MSGNSIKVKYSISVGSFYTILFFIFLVLKLTNVISWSWWIVTAPLWFPVASSIIILAIHFALIFYKAYKGE